jgi:hypothetical protein
MRPSIPLTKGYTPTFRFLLQFKVSQYRNSSGSIVTDEYGNSARGGVPAGVKWPELEAIYCGVFMVLRHAVRIIEFISTCLHTLSITLENTGNTVLSLI